MSIHNIKPVFNGRVYGGYDIDFQSTPQNGNDLVNMIEHAFVDEMAGMFLKAMHNYEYRRKQMLHLVKTGVEEWEAAHAN